MRSVVAAIARLWAVDLITGVGATAEANPAASSAGTFYKAKPIFRLYRDH
jgi:hypothetical protein